MQLDWRLVEECKSRDGECGCFPTGETARQAVPGSQARFARKCSSLCTCGIFTIHQHDVKVLSSINATIHI